MEQDALTEYEKKQTEIKALLKQIRVGLEKHDRSASKNGGHHWGHVGDLTRIAIVLTELRNQLLHTGK